MSQYTERVEKLMERFPKGFKKKLAYESDVTPQTVTKFFKKKKIDPLVFIEILKNMVKIIHAYEVVVDDILTKGEESTKEI